MTEPVVDDSGQAMVLPEDKKVFVRLPRIDENEMAVIERQHAFAVKQAALSLTDAYTFKDEHEEDKAAKRIAIARVYEAYFLE